MRHLVGPIAAIPVALLLTGCVAPHRAAVVESPPEVYVPAPPHTAVSVYVEPPISQPEPVAVAWAPPPLLVESPPPPPFEGAVWVGGYWVWHGDWVWAHGRWVGAPRPNYVWVHPYYEHRDGMVIFITGHWSPPGVAFVPPPPGIHLTVEAPAAGVVPGPRPMGPNGCFIPPPPGSRPGIIIPAPIGTAPAVMTGAPPVVAVGMHVTSNISNTTNTVTKVKKVTNVTNITNVTIVAPPGATANGQAVNTSVPAQAHLAAAQTPVIKAQAPEPASSKPIPAFVHGRPPVALPPAQPVNAIPSEPKQAHTNTPRPDSKGRAAPGSNGRAAAGVKAAKTTDPQGGKAHVAGNPNGTQHADADAPKPKAGATAGQPKQDHDGQDGVKHSANPQPGKPVSAPLTAANAKNKSADPGKHPSGAEASAKAKAAQTEAKNKNEHPKKPGDKDVKQDHEAG